MEFKLQQSELLQNHTFALEVDQESIVMEKNYSQKFMKVGLLDTSITESEKSKTNYRLGVLFFTISSLSYSIMVTFAKLTFRLNPELTPYDISLIRGIMLFTLFSLYARYQGVSLVKFNGNALLCLTTSFADSIAIACLLNSMKYISATKTMLIIQ